MRKTLQRALVALPFVAIPLLAAAWPANDSAMPKGRGDRWILAYAGDSGRLNYGVNEFIRLIAAVDTTGKPTEWLSNGVVFATLSSRKGHHFASWIGEPYATGEDWQGYVDELFAPGGSLARLDSAVSLVESTLGQPPRPFKVAVVTLYPEEKARTFSFGGKNYLFNDAAGRAAASAAYINEVTTRFDSAHYRFVKLDAFYWLHESIHGAEEQVVPLVANAVHAAGKRFLWVPFFTAWGIPNWRKFGFDEVWIQPNYFFNLNLNKGRLDSAVAKARALNMGLEMEFDGRSYAKADYYDRLDAYLDVLSKAPDLRSRDVLTYEGGGALITLSKSRVPREQALYHRFVSAVGLTPPGGE